MYSHCQSRHNLRRLSRHRYNSRLSIWDNSKSPSRGRQYRIPGRSPTCKHRSPHHTSRNRRSPTLYTCEVSDISLTTPKPSEASTSSSSDTDDSQSHPVKANSCKRICLTPKPHMPNTYSIRHKSQSDRESDTDPDDSQMQTDTDSVISSLPQSEDEHSLMDLMLPKPSKVSSINNNTKSPEPATGNFHMPIQKEVLPCTLSQPTQRYLLCHCHLLKLDNTSEKYSFQDHYYAATINSTRKDTFQDHVVHTQQTTSTTTT